MHILLKLNSYLNKRNSVEAKNKSFGSKIKMKESNISSTILKILKVQRSFTSLGFSTFRAWFSDQLGLSQKCQGLRGTFKVIKMGPCLRSNLPSVMTELDFIWLWPLDHRLTLKMTKISSWVKNAFFLFDEKLFK